MIRVERLAGYDDGLATEMGKLLEDLSSKDTGAPISREWIESIVASPWHVQLLAFDEDELVGMATVSVVLGAHIGRDKFEEDKGGPNVGRNVYLEDCVVSKKCQGKGIGKLLWNEVVAWGREKGAKRLEFSTTGGDRKTGAVGFYLKMGAEIRETNFFRFEL